MAGADAVVADLRAESDELDALVANLPEERWRVETPAPGWTIAHQIAHLLWTDRVAVLAVTDEPGFAEVLTEAATNPTGFVDEGAEELSAMPPAEMLDEWRRSRTRLHDELLTVADGRKLPWFGPPMSAASMATARLMETWAHGLDVADALGRDATRHGPSALDRSHRGAHEGFRIRRPRAACAGRAVPRRTAGARGRDVVVGPRRRRAAGDGIGRGLLSAGYTTPSARRARRDRRGCRRADVVDDRAGVRGPARARALVVSSRSRRRSAE